MNLSLIPYVSAKPEIKGDHGFGARYCSKSSVGYN